MKKQQGFTLIELVMVIVILGILAAVALPKFVDLQGDAKKASLSGALGAVKSASSMAHAASLIADSNSVDIEGTTYTLVNGYPDAGDIADLAGLSSEYTITATSGTVTTVSLATNCHFTYTEATSTAPAAFSTITDSGC